MSQPVLARVRKPNATVTIAVDARLMFSPTGPITNWKRDTAAKITLATKRHAPSNKRPRWRHYGTRTLKTSIATSLSKGDWAQMRGRAYVYSSLPYAEYVDQGTGVFNGRSPWVAEVLPPWTEGGASLYEATWWPARNSASVMIKGQEGQGFFAKGLIEGMYQQGVFVRPGAVPLHAMRADPLPLPDPEPEMGFRASLEQWRAWRDSAFYSGKVLGQGRVETARAQEVATWVRFAGTNRTTRGGWETNKFRRWANKRDSDRPLTYEDRMREYKEFLASEARARVNRQVGEADKARAASSGRTSRSKRTTEQRVRDNLDDAFSNKIRASVAALQAKGLTIDTEQSKYAPNGNSYVIVYVNKQGYRSIQSIARPGRRR